MDRSSERPDAAPDLPRADGILGGPDLGQELARWAADAAVDEAARARARARWLRVQADESASLAGTLMTLAERAQAVVLDVADQRLGGLVVGIGDDFVAMRTDIGQHVLVRTEVIAAVRAGPGAAVVVGDRSPLLEVGLAGVLVPMAADRPTVLVRTTAATSIRGELRAAGTDVIRIRVDADPPATAWVPVAAIAVVVLHP